MPRQVSILEQQTTGISRYDVDFVNEELCIFTVTLNTEARAASMAQRKKDSRVCPAFFRVRCVHAAVTSDSKRLVLRCTCGFYYRYLSACRHIYAVKGLYSDTFDVFENVHFSAFIAFHLGALQGPPYVRAF